MLQKKISLKNNSFFTIYRQVKIKMLINEMKVVSIHMSSQKIISLGELYFIITLLRADVKSLLCDILYKIIQKLLKKFLDSSTGYI